MVFGGRYVGLLAFQFELELTDGGLEVHITPVEVGVVRVRVVARACVI